MSKKSNSFEKELLKFKHSFQLAMLELEKDVHKKRVIKRMDSHLAVGRRMFGTPPSWYQMKDGFMQPFMPNAKIVQKTYHALIKGKLEKSSPAITAFMEKMGFTDRNGTPIQPTRHHVRTLLSERSIMEAAGFIYFRTGWIKAKHKAIISEQDAMNLLGKSKFAKSNCAAVVYCRTANKQDTAGIHDQEKLCRAYCKAHGYKVAAIFKDEAISGNSRERPALSDLMAYMQKSSKPHVLVVKDMARIARDLSIGLEITEKLKNAGWKIEVVSF